MNKIVSVIIPVYNCDSYLEECLDSIISQTYSNIEIIVVDDGSTDKSSRILDEYVSKDSRIKLIHQENQGVSVARNVALENATGDYIMFVDADDYLATNDAVENLIKVASNTNVDVLLYKRVRSTRGSIDTARNSINDILIGEMIVSESINTLWNKLYKRDIIDKNNIRFPEGIRMGEDLLFNAKFFHAAKAINFLDEELYFYREDNQASATKRYMPNKYNDLMYVNNKLATLFSQKGSDISNALNYIRIKNVLSCIRDLHNEACTLNEDEKRREIEKYKQENPGMIVYGYGLVKFVISLMYSYMSAWILYRMMGLVVRR